MWSTHKRYCGWLQQLVQPAIHFQTKLWGEENWRNLKKLEVSQTNKKFIFNQWKISFSFVFFSAQAKMNVDHHNSIQKGNFTIHDDDEKNENLIDFVRSYFGWFTSGSTWIAKWSNDATLWSKCITWCIKFKLAWKFTWTTVNFVGRSSAIECHKNCSRITERRWTKVSMQNVSTGKKKVVLEYSLKILRVHSDKKFVINSTSHFYQIRFRK